MKIFKIALLALLPFSAQALLNTYTAQTITWGPTPTLIVAGAGQVSATASSGLPVVLSVTTPKVCDLSNSTVSAKTAGNCIIQAAQAGNNTYTPIKSTLTIVIPFINQTLTVGILPNLGLDTTATGTLDVTSTSTLPITVVSKTPLVCVTSGMSVTAKAAGTCSIVAAQAGNLIYSPATSVTITLTIAAGSQTVTFGAAPTLSVGVSGKISVTDNSKLPIKTSSTTPSICTVSGATVVGKAAGTCTVSATVDKTANWGAASATQDIVVSKGNQVLKFGPAPSLLFGGTAKVSATSSATALIPVITSTTTDVCTVTSNVVTPVKVGACILQAAQVGDLNFNAATPINLTINVAKGNQVLKFGPLPKIAVGQTGTVAATASTGLTVTISSKTPTVCTVSGNVVTALLVGNCIILADQSGDVNHIGAPQGSATIAISKDNQTITFGAVPSLAVNDTGTVTATATSGLPVVLASATPAVCTFVDPTVTAKTAGKCSISGNQTGNGTYLAAPKATLTFVITKGTQTITFNAPSDTKAAIATKLVATSDSKLPVSFTSSTKNVCTITGATFIGKVAGSCTIAADQSGNVNYGPAAQVSVTFNILPK